MLDYIDDFIPRCILNRYREQHIYRVTLLSKEYTFSDEALGPRMDKKDQTAWIRIN
jgi:hypothetical protein